MQNKQIKGVVIAGGGTAGWITAALLNKVLGKMINITLIESSKLVLWEWVKRAFRQFSP